MDTMPTHGQTPGEHRPQEPSGERAGQQAIWSLAGGKGGVGRSLLAANLGIQLARSGKRVVMVDLDLQGCNLHTYLGFQRLPRTLFDFATGAITLLSEAACETPTGNLRLVGGVQHSDLREDPVAFVRRVVEQFPSLAADNVIVDCGSGRSPGTVAAFSEGTLGILITTPEPAAIESLYLFMEAHVRWCLVRAVTGEAMAGIEQRMREAQIDPARSPFRLFMTRLGRIDPDARERIARTLRHTRLELLVNQVRGEHDEESAASLASGFRKCFGLGLQMAGLIEHDPSALQAIQKRRSLSQQYPNAAATKGIARAANRLLGAASAPQLTAEEEWEDFEALDHYRVLEVVPKASPKEVQAAYQLLKRTYDPETTFLAPILEAPGLRDLLARIESAYRTLIFLESRATYDRQMLERGALKADEIRGLHPLPGAPGGVPDPAGAPPVAPLEIAGGQMPAAPVDGNPTASDLTLSTTPVPTRPVSADGSAPLPDPSAADPLPATPSGPRIIPSSGAALREERQRLSLSLGAIANKTKIRPAYLQAIEEERFADLPAAVFVRGFLREYARCLGLPGNEVSRLYMKRYQDWQESHREPPAAARSIG